MFQVRQGVFETNSSSTHSLTVCSQSDYDKWKNGEVYLNDGWWITSNLSFKNNTFITKDEAVKLIACNGYIDSDKDIESMDDEEFNECLKDNDIYTFDNYWDNYLEYYVEDYTSEHGDEIVVFGQYGYN